MSILVCHAVDEGLNLQPMAQHQEPVQLDAASHLFAHGTWDSLLVVASNLHRNSPAKDPVSRIGAEPPGTLEASVSELFGKVAGHIKFSQQLRLEDQRPPRSECIACLARPPPLPWDQ